MSPTDYHFLPLTSQHKDFEALVNPIVGLQKTESKWIERTKGLEKTRFADFQVSGKKGIGLSQIMDVLTKLS